MTSKFFCHVFYYNKIKLTLRRKYCWKLPKLFCLMIEGQEYEPNIFLKIVIMAGGPAQLDTIALATYKNKIKI